MGVAALCKMVVVDQKRISSLSNEFSALVVKRKTRVENLAISM